ncbi:MAG TPA: glycosyltransferase family 39 protein [Rhizomicrobium sp.]|nr:glycosyltransferase family 39 protein [Rhizomicrobium sp.]
MALSIGVAPGLIQGRGPHQQVRPAEGCIITESVKTGLIAQGAALLLRRPFAALALICALLWLPGLFSLPPLDRDESRFAQASRQMLESGNYIDIRFGFVPRYKKPVGIYWLQSATTAVAGGGDVSHIWTYRLASFLGGLAAAWLTFWIARSVAPPGAAFAAASLLAGTLLLSAESIIATTDAVLLATVVGAQGVLLRAYLAARIPGGASLSLGLALAGWAAIGIGILIKGPVTPCVCLATALVLSLTDRDARWLRATRPLLGLGLVLLIVLPWVIAIWIQSHGAFFTQSLGTDFAGKLAGGQESHGAPPGYYLALVSLALWPATLFLIPAIAFAVQQRTQPVVRFLIVWTLVVWIVAEIVPTKLPHYVLPAYPALAVLMALWLASPARLKHARLLLGAAVAQYGLGLLALAAAPIVVVMLYAGHVPLWLVAASLGGVVIGGFAIVRVLKGDWGGAIASALGGAIVLYGALTLGAAPQLQQLWVSERAATLVAKDALPGDPPVVLAGYEEPSLVFRLGATTRLAVDGAVAASTIADSGGLALIEQRQSARFHHRLAALGVQAVRLDTLTGLNYSRGKKVSLTLYRVVPVSDVIVPPAE